MYDLSDVDGNGEESPQVSAVTPRKSKTRKPLDDTDLACMIPECDDGHKNTTFFLSMSRPPLGELLGPS